jgi:hypothetical protein
MTFDCHNMTADQGFTGGRVRQSKQSSCKGWFSGGIVSFGHALC